MKSRGTRRIRVQVEEVTPYTPTKVTVKTVTDEDSAKKSSQVIDTTPLSYVLPDCPEDRACCKSCQAYRDGKCAALADVYFPDNICPFYKEREQAQKERIAAMEKLETDGRYDLIDKYYKNHSRFDKILANEMVGIPYEFDDDNYGRAKKASQPEQDSQESDCTEQDGQEQDSQSTDNNESAESTETEATA